LIPTGATSQIFQNPALNNRDEVTGKFDWNPTEKDNFSVLLGRTQNPTLNPANVPGFGTTTVNHRQFANIAYTRIISSTKLNEFRVTAQRNDNLQAVPASTLPLPNALGVNINSDNPTGPTRLTFTGLTIGFSVQGPTSLIDNTFGFSDTFSWTHLKHTMKFGASYSPYETTRCLISLSMAVWDSVRETGPRTPTPIFCSDCRGPIPNSQPRLPTFAARRPTSSPRMNGRSPAT